jgi:hypothetical protein
MSNATLLHLVLGALLLIPGVWFLIRGRLALGWMLSILGSAIGIMGIVVPVVHRHLHH